jgi:hypothetical protein
MSYRRKPRCGYCRQEGHNRTKCPVIMKRIEERLAANPNDWWANQQLEKNKPKTKADRTCSYCTQKGHTRRTCEVKSNDLAYIKNYMVEGRKAIAKICEEHPSLIGKGDMFIHEGQEWFDGSYRDFKRPFITTGITLDLDHRTPIVELKAVVPSRYGVFTVSSIALAKILSCTTENDYHFTLKPASKSGKKMVFSDAWLRGDDLDLEKHEYFKGGKAKSSKRRQWEIYSIVDNEQKITYESIKEAINNG